MTPRKIGVLGPGAIGGLIFARSYAPGIPASRHAFEALTSLGVLLALVTSRLGAIHEGRGRFRVTTAGPSAAPLE